MTSRVIVSVRRALYIGDRPKPLRRRTERSIPMSNVNELVINYLAAWNERDAKRRRDLVARTWADGGSYLDAHRRGVGHDAIDAMIAAAQQMFPGYRLRLVSGIETHNGHIRFSWA